MKLYIEYNFIFQINWKKKKENSLDPTIYYLLKGEVHEYLDNLSKLIGIYKVKLLVYF